MTKIYVGIDNGSESGGLAAIRKSDGLLLARISMPNSKYKNRPEVDVRGVDDFLESLGDSGITIVIEEPGGSKSATAAKSMSGCFHALRALCELRQYRWFRITPQSWQAKMLPGVKGDSKKEALAACRRLWPKEDFLATNRSKVPHAGILDACLIAQFARQQNL